MGKTVLKRTFSSSDVYTCPICHSGSPMLRVPIACKLYGLKPNTIHELVRSQRVHAVTMPDHLLWVCQSSLPEFREEGKLPVKTATVCLALQAMELINQRYREPGLTLGGIASFLGKSIWHLDRVLNSELGIGFRAYLRGLRLQGVADLLRQPSLSIKQIAAEMGYKSTSDMDHHFKSRYGLSPSAYRRGGVETVGQVLPTKSKNEQQKPLAQGSQAC